MYAHITFETAPECLKKFEVSDVAEAVATRKDRFVNRYALNSSVVCEICIMCSTIIFKNWADTRYKCRFRSCNITSYKRMKNNIATLISYIDNISNM